MALSIRPAQAADLAQIMDIYAAARQFMIQSGNPTQWGSTYPQPELVQRDLDAGNLYVCMDDSSIAGVFCYFCGMEPDYLQIFDGNWPNDLPYGVVHRLAVASRGKGVAAFCLAYAFNSCGNLRIDTHADNKPMQRALTKNGFAYCGIIHCSHGGERMAYQKA